MNIDAAIAKLKEFKKASKSSGIGPCDLVGFDDKSFTVRVRFGEEPPAVKPILGFAGGAERKSSRRKV